MDREQFIKEASFFSKETLINALMDSVIFKEYRENFIDKCVLVEIDKLDGKRENAVAGYKDIKFKNNDPKEFLEYFAAVESIDKEIEIIDKKIKSLEKRLSWKKKKRGKHE